MLTALLLKAGYILVGAVVGWFGKKFHMSLPAIDASEEKTPSEKP